MVRKHCRKCSAAIAESDEYCVRCLVMLGLEHGSPEPGGTSKLDDTDGPREGDVTVADAPGSTVELEPGRQLAHYRIVEKIGAGGMGEVYRAWDENLERDIAIKVLPTGRIRNSDARARFRKEALALSRLNHPNIQTVHDFDTQGQIDFLVTEYVPGVTLSDRLRSSGLPEEEVVRLGEQLASGLAAAHAQRIIHRDLKPGNLRLKPDGGLKILDFGLAKLAPSPDENISTRTETIAGTPRYMAPEQRLGFKVDARSDIYAAGLVLQEMATGLQKSGGEAARASGISSRLRPIVEKCTREDPAERYQSAEELLAAFRRARREPNRRRRAVVVGALVAAVALIGTLSGIGLRRSWDSRLRGAQPGPVDSLVALPSTVVGPEADVFLAGAIPNTISAYLAQVEGLETKLPPSSFDLERLRGDLDRVAETYDVNKFVLSTVTTRAEQFVLNLQLVEARTRRLLWSNEYDGQRSTYIEVIRQAAEDLRQQIRPAAGAIADKGLAGTSQAELAYQRGRYHANRFNNLHRQEDFEQAFSALQETLRLDPGLSDAAALTGALFEWKLEAGMDPQDSAFQLDFWARRALEIDSENGLAWGLLTLLDDGQGRKWSARLEKALRAVRFAPRADPSHVALFFSLPSCRLGLEATREAARLNPLYMYAPLLSSTASACLGRTDEALDEIESVLEIEPDMPTALVIKAGHLLQAGRLEEATSLLQQLERVAAEGLVHPAWVSAYRDVALVLRDDPAAEAARERLLRIARGESPFLYWQRFAKTAMWILASQDRISIARELLLAIDESAGGSPYDSLRLNPSMSRVLDDPSTRAVVAKSRAEFEELMGILDDARARGELPPYLERSFEDLRTLIQ